MSYQTPPPRFDPDRAAELRVELARAVRTTPGDPAFRNLTLSRGIPADVVLAARDVLFLPPPILDHAKTEHGIVSLLRPAPGAEPTGVEIAFVDRLGAKTSDRRTWAFVERGCVDAWFWAGGSGDRVIACEGFLAKPLAALAAGVPGLVVGWGSRSWLAAKPKLPATIKRMLIVPDRRPGEAEVGEDGKPLREGHDRDTRRGTDRWLLELGESAVELAADPGVLGKDLDEVLRNHGVAAVRDLLERATPARLSEDGWITKLGRMAGFDYDQSRKDFASQLGVRLSTLDAMRKQGQAGAASDDKDDTKRTRLVALAVRQDLFQDDGGEGFAAVELDGGAVRTFKVEGSAFSDWLIAEYGRAYPETVAGREVPGSVSSSTLADALRTILAVARQGETRAVYLRLGWGPDRLFLDMATPEPRALEISPDGWAVVVDPPVHLVFSPTAKPLPVPVPGTRKAVLRQLQRFFGFRPNDDRLVLLVGVLMAGLMPRGPYPILILSGEQGSGKTSRSRFIKLAIDPTKASVRGRPRSAEDLAISVWRSWFGLFDNLSKLDQDMSDWLCRLSEGAGLPKRKLYTDTEEILIEAARPIMLTAIPDIAQSGDVIDRAVLIRCDPLPTKIREQVLLDQFDGFRPQLLAYLIEAASCGLRRFGEMVDEHDGLRRGDWCAWVEAAAPALGWRAERFTKAYRRNQDQAVRLALELDPVAAAVLDYMATEHEVEIGVTPLHSALETIARRQHTGRLPLDWPSMAHHFSGRLRRLAPMLRRVGVEVEHEHTRVGSKVRLTNLSNRSDSRTPSEDVRQAASPASPASHFPEAADTGGDARDARDALEHTSSYASRETPSSNGPLPNGDDPASDRCVICNQPLAGGCPVATPEGGAHYACVAKPAEPPPPPKKSRIRRGKSA